ncbi:YheC/YheD family protein [Alicyclobacillus tolerans]|uniref:YheC/YheD family protein n=1 Tax=Alicyclobacillus tolerans TaxID=90970 RepID=UPI001F180061|nr:YheC/YheD family protein [Alicyclobacillus tolerans]MCF8565003.1 YheC/YheD family protein [Alicyclobacillus tolerans]
MGIGMLDLERGYLNKWEMYKALQGEQIGPCRLPVTQGLSGSSLGVMLKKFRKVYVKPIDSWGGNFVSVVAFESGKYSWTMQQHSQQQYPTLSKLMQDLSAAYAHQICIVQQAAPLLGYQGRPFDIRVHMQRNTDDSWIYAGALVRAGGAKSIVSNVGISDGAVLPLENVLLAVLAKPKARRIPVKLENIGYSIAGLLDNYRDFNEIGIDLGVDRDGQLWLIEVNTDDALGAPSHEIFADLPDPTIYKQLRHRAESRQMAMAKSLLEAFFLVEDNN